MPYSLDLTNPTNANATLLNDPRVAQATQADNIKTLGRRCLAIQLHAFNAGKTAVENAARLRELDELRTFFTLVGDIKTQVNAHAHFQNRTNLFAKLNIAIENLLLRISHNIWQICGIEHNFDAMVANVVGVDLTHLFDD
jgi:hypothetical protein